VKKNRDGHEMNRKKLRILNAFLTTMLVMMISIQLGQMHIIIKADTGSVNGVAMEYVSPIIKEISSVDRDANGVHDSLDQEINKRILNGTANEYANIIVMTRSDPTADDTGKLSCVGGQNTTSLWTKAICGFGARIPYDRIMAFKEQCSNVLFVEKESVFDYKMYYAAEQVGARPYVWQTRGFQGDPNSSIAIIDSGIDATHLDFSPGFGDQNFSKKIIGWKDEIDHTTSPFDDQGHGSSCAGLAAGNGFFSNDSSGNAIATYEAHYDWIPKLMNLTGFMVNKTGTITLTMKYILRETVHSNISDFVLMNGEKSTDPGQWVQVSSVSAPDNDTWYTLTYNVSSMPSGGYDKYQVGIVARTNSVLNVAFLIKMSWPYMSFTDGFPVWTGIAPQTKLYCVRQNGSSSQIIDGINWIIIGRTHYHITTVSMSFGSLNQDAFLNEATRNLVNYGITVVVAAGNEYAPGGGNRVNCPGSVDEVITVAAMNQFDSVSHYSSQGGTSAYEGHTQKPDIMAPGGSPFYSSSIFSVDSNYNDSPFPEAQPDDALAFQGTSAATPIVAGAVNIIMQAMGGFSYWQWTRSKALAPKMLLLMTASETYPKLRELYPGDSPTLERGGKDIHEGFGRINLDAAVDAINQTYQVTSTVNCTLGSPPSVNDVSTLGQGLVWARNVQLATDGSVYTFTLNVPVGADYDLYMYNSTGTSYGEPFIVAKSTTNATGGVESISLSAPYTGTYYLVVKRATETTGTGTFTLTSSIRDGGGCPYVYVWNGSYYVKDNNILPASEIGNGTDTKDYYKLEQPLTPTRQNRHSSIYSLKIREFESERDYLDQVQLKSIDHADSVSIAVTGSGEIITYHQPDGATTCTDNNGTDRLSKISTMNGNVSDPGTYFQGYAGDWLLLNFGNVTASNANLILRDDQKCMDVCINVQVPDNNGSWQTIDVLHPRSFWSMEAVNMTAYIPQSGNFTVRLYWMAPHRLDYVGLDTSGQAPVTVSSTTPILAIHSTLGDVTQKLLYDDENIVELVNGQEVTIDFVLPKNAANTTRDFIFFTNGYYYKITP